MRRTPFIAVLIALLISACRGGDQASSTPAPSRIAGAETAPETAVSTQETPTPTARMPATPVPSATPTQLPQPSPPAVASETAMPTPQSLPVLAKWQGTSGPAYSVDWSPDGQRVVAGT